MHVHYLHACAIISEKLLGPAEATSKQLEHEDPYTPPGTELSSTTAGSEAGVLLCDVWFQRREAQKTRC